MSHRAFSFFLQCLLLALLSHAQTTVPLTVKVQLDASGTGYTGSVVVSDAIQHYLPCPSPPTCTNLTNPTATASTHVTVELVEANHYQIAQYVYGSAAGARADVYWSLPATVTATAGATTTVTLGYNANLNVIIDEYGLFYLNVSNGISLVSAGCLEASPTGSAGSPPTCPGVMADLSGTSGSPVYTYTKVFQGTASPLKVANPTTQGASTTECGSGSTNGATCDVVMTTDIFLKQTQTTGPVTIAEVDNGFSNVPNSPIQSGMWAVIKGTNLASTNPGRGWNSNESFPTTMDGTSVTINNQPAFLYFISPTQLNLQAPTDTALGPVSVVVTNNGVSSAPVTAQYQSSAPALLQWGGGQYSYAEITRGSDYIGNPAVVQGTVSARSGDTLTLWATGLGATTPPLPAGQQPTTTFPTVNTLPTVTVGGINATVLAAVLRYAGLYQVNIQLPPSLPAGDLPIKLIQGSYQSPDGVLINIAMAP